MQVTAMTGQLLNEEIVTELDISHLTIEDDTPVYNLQSEKQQRLLVELSDAEELRPGDIYLVLPKQDLKTISRTELKFVKRQI